MSPTIRDYTGALALAGASSPIIRDCLGERALDLRGEFGARQPVVAYGTASVPGIVWTRRELGMFAEHIQLATRPGSHTEQAREARGLDKERFDAAIADVYPFTLARIEFCNNQNMRGDVLIYSDASDVPNIVDRIGTQLRRGEARLFPAWWWGQGEPGDGPAGLEPLVAELERLGVTVDPDWIALWQYAAPGAGLPADAFWDESKAYGRIDWAR